MKSFYKLFCAAVGILLITPVSAEDAKPAKVDVFAVKAIPEGKYSVRLELKERDGVAVTVELNVKDGRIVSTDESGKFGKIRGGSFFIANGVFMVQLKGEGYLATQYWAFQPDGTIAIKEIPDRGEKQVAVRVDEKKAP
jgi:hypothetical protein